MSSVKPSHRLLILGSGVGWMAFGGGWLPKELCGYGSAYTSDQHMLALCLLFSLLVSIKLTLLTVLATYFSHDETTTSNRILNVYYYIVASLVPT